MKKAFIFLFLSFCGFISAQNSIGITTVDNNGESAILLPSPISRDPVTKVPIIEGKLAVPIKGKSLGTLLSNNKPNFIFHLITKQDSIESKAATKIVRNIPFAYAKKASDFDLVKLYKQDDFRAVRIEGFEIGGEIIMLAEDLIPFKESVIGNRTFKVALEKPLASGEYAFKLKQEIPECDTYFYSFTIK